MPKKDLSQYWNPKNECLRRKELKALQLFKLRKLTEWAYENSPFHKRKFKAAKFEPRHLKSLDDIERIPFMTREEWMESQISKPLFGNLLAAPKETAIRYHTTSGTSGRIPIRVLDGMKDWQWISECWAYGFYGFGVRRSDTVFFAFSYGTFIGFWGAHYACEKIGSLVLPSGNTPTEARVKTILELGATVVCATPTYALRLAQAATEMGLNIKNDSKVEKLILSGEPAGSIPATKRMIEDVWSAKAGDTAGMTEIGTIMIFECSHQPGGTHIIEDHFIEEVVDPDTGERLDYGSQGERVVTSFGRGFIPLIRYRTKDLVEKVPYSECTCGRTGDIYKGGILGRTDDMKLIRGTNVYPRAVEAIVREYDAIDEFQILLTREGGIRDEITVRVELKPGCENDWDKLQSKLANALAEAHEMLRFNIERADAGILPRFELKAKRLVDKRGE